MFSPATQAWFDSSFAAPTQIQTLGWAAVSRGGHTLLVAPTGSGKTLAAFLAGIDSIVCEDPSERKARPGTRVLYVSPLKALVYDVERNLRAPLAGIRLTADRLGERVPQLDVAVRTGDTPQRERQRQIRVPGDVLVTTPESLFLITGSRARETLRTVHTLIVDEVHALAPTKRGAHLALTLERVCEITDAEPQRIGLSATVRPLDEVARYLGGDRPVEIVDASSPPRLDLRVTVPVPDMTQVAPPSEFLPVPATADDSSGDAPGTTLSRGPHRGPGTSGWSREQRGGSVLGELYDREVHVPMTERGIWPALYPRLLEEITSNRSTILFTNSRGLCERLSQRLNELAGENLVRAHHGSVSHEKRAEIEDALKRGELRGIVATSSLELGIDMGAVDRVVLVESPGSVARGLQRVGRAGHQVGEISVGRIYPKFRGDLLECAVVSSLMVRAELEAIETPRNALDVLSQQIVALCCDRSRSVDEIESLVRRSYPYQHLTRGALEAVLDMLSGKYPSADFADLRPLLSWDRTRDVLSARRGAPMVSRMNAGTIPDRGHYAVHLGSDGPRVGELDEEMVFETRTGDVILLGATTWRVEEMTRDRVVVSPAPGEPGRLPFWKGEGPGRPVEIGREIGAFLRGYAAAPKEQKTSWIRERAPLDAFAAQNLAAYLDDQIEHTGTLPTDEMLCVERFRDELGDWRICILTPFGARLHAPWSMALQRVFSRRTGFETQIMYSEDGIVLRLADADELPPLELLLPSADEIEDLVTEQLAETALFAGLFRENAVRSLLLPRRRPTQRNPLWAQRLKSQQLLATVREFPSFPIVLETYRQALRDVFDLPALARLLRDVESRKIRVREVTTPTASPFARSLVFGYVAAYMYEQDAPMAERRAQALAVDRNLLSELLGQAELRELIDPDVLAEMEAELQLLTEDRRARDADELHDLLRRLGDLTEEELVRRANGDPGPWLRELERARRAASVRLAGETRWIMAEDAGLYRDAFGVLPPPGLPEAFLGPVDLPLEQIVRRYARHHGPFLAGDLARRYGLRADHLEPLLRELDRTGALVRGEIRPGGMELDYCDAEVLRRLKRRTLARLRKEVAPAEGRTLGLFLPLWHGCESEDRSEERLLEAIVQLEGLTLPWSELCDVILPQRVTGFSVEQLDRLCASGQIVWVGRSASGPRDGRVSLYLREHAGTLLESSIAETSNETPSRGKPPSEKPSDDDGAELPINAAHTTILEALRSRGALFLAELERIVRAERSELDPDGFREALWDLVWAGRITNDTFGPLLELRGWRRAGAHRGGRAGARRRRVFATSGRWWLVDSLIDPAVETTERALLRTRVMLERYGVLSRDAAAAENLPGGFAPLYKVLTAMEESGRIRRGYYVEGLGGAQFAHAGAVERMRSVRPVEDGDERLDEADVRVLSAVDPANPYGALLPWPDQPDAAPRARRAAGASVVLVAGFPVLYVGPGARQVSILPWPGRALPELLRLAVPALRRLPRRLGRSRLRIEEVDGVPVERSEHLALFVECGFERSYRGLVPLRG